MAKSMQSRALWSVRAIRGVLPITLLLLLIEFFDELDFGSLSAALPLIRSDLGMSYAQAGLLLGIPAVVAAFIEPVLMLLGDTRLRKALIVGGGLTVVAATLALSAANSFPMALAAFIVAFPASGAFVTLSQATLMDHNPGREAQMMARWTVFGSAGNLLGPAMLALAYTLGFTWRNTYWLIAALGLVLVILALPQRFGRRNGRVTDGEEHAGEAEDEAPAEAMGLRDIPAAIPQALRTPGLLRWTILLDFSDLMLDVFLSFSALYFADVVGLAPTRLGLLMSFMMAADLISNLALIPLLEKVPGRTVLRVSAFVTAGLYIAWLLIPGAGPKMILAIALRFSTVGWYEVLQGESYAALPGRSGTVMAINSVMGLLQAGMVWLIGQTAESLGLPAAMWLLLAGPLALIWLVPRKR